MELATAASPLNRGNGNDNLYKLIDCSIDRIKGNNAEVTAELEKILASSRANNPHLI
jgi:hypothetical protein